MKLETIKIFIQELLFGTEEREFYTITSVMSTLIVISFIVPIPLGYDPIVGFITFILLSMLSVVLFIIYQELPNMIRTIWRAVEDSYNTAIEESNK